jgi:arylsulfatase A-like enzyme
MLCALALAACQPGEPQELGAHNESRPNLVLVIADDISWDDIGAYGHPHIHTPHLDEMARKGIVFNNAFLTASSCSPSRASIVTGRYPHNTDAEELHWPLPSEQITFPEKLKENGYWTVASGKWHLGPQVIDRFDLVEEVAYAAEDNYSGGDTWPRLIRERPKDKPFFMWLASWDAHRAFPEGDLPHNHTEADLVIPPYYPQTSLMKQSFLHYYDEVARFDLLVGNVVKALEEEGVAENTLVIVMADNGRPYARDKTTMHDSGMKTPFIAYWPGRLPEGVTSQAILSAVDIAPTFLHLSGTAVPDTVQGESFHELLENPGLKFRDYAFSEKNWHDFTDHGRTVRSRRFRYIRNHYTDLPATPTADTVYDPIWAERVEMYRNGELTALQQVPFVAPRPSEELYDLEADPLELHNLATDEDYRDILVEHRAVLDNWIEETGDFIPSIRTPDDFDRMTGAKLPTRERPRRSKKEMYGHGPY